jgi:hypothetical protein
MEQFKAVNEAEGAAVKALLAYMQGGGSDNKKLMQLTDQMTSAHDKKMGIYQELQRFRLDK